MTKANNSINTDWLTAGFARLQPAVMSDVSDKGTLTMHQRRTLLKLIVAALTAPLTGCATKALLAPTSTEYVEQVSSILISENNKHIVVITERYHYVFSPNQLIATSVTGSFKKYLSADFSSFFVNANGDVSGSVALTVINLPLDELEKVKAAGFSVHGKNGTAITTIHGKRFKPSTIDVPSAYKLNRTYTVRITEESSPNTAKQALTPVTLAMDGVLFILGAPLMTLVVLSNCKQGSCD